MRRAPVGRRRAPATRRPGPFRRRHRWGRRQAEARPRRRLLAAPESRAPSRLSRRQPTDAPVNASLQGKVGTHGAEGGFGFDGVEARHSARRPRARRAGPPPAELVEVDEVGKALEQVEIARTCASRVLVLALALVLRVTRRRPRDRVGSAAGTHAIDAARPMRPLVIATRTGTCLAAPRSLDRARERACGPAACAARNL